jgi:transcriptional regulator with XRE-family HTH domain
MKNITHMNNISIFDQSIRKIRKPVSLKSKIHAKPTSSVQVVSTSSGMVAQDPFEFPIRKIREEMGLSQKSLADKMGVERTRLTRLEKKVWSELSLGEVELLAKGLGLKWKELMERFKNQSETQPLYRSSMKEPCFIIDSGKGYRFSSLIEKPKKCFIGTLHLQPQKILSFDQAPRSEMLFYFILEGELLLTCETKEYLIREKETFMVAGNQSYELYNPHQFCDATALLFSAPSFVCAL